MNYGRALSWTMLATPDKKPHIKVGIPQHQCLAIYVWNSSYDNEASTGLEIELYDENAENIAWP